MLRIIAVAVGGSIGATARYLVSVWAAERFGADFPYGTLIVNVVGCFIIGIFMTLTTERFIVNPYWRLLITVGFVGGLTTFSSFSYETFRVLEDSNMIMALYNIGLNLLLGFAATWIGIGVARLI
ncbi:fluoride efflux transporter CrcB [Pelosinus baikalensis]|jgi:CrcB protein|uniref:Fluoride-specific ion channel FluC n=1 Tax=Pelosinus baikalensis TaxID=2892015 RepID=A0ABS8I1P8_9FIRM|nr:fluoride efflux transporter CrcB [Pelosinus baikalensis]MCC5468557.1 fluoride efflux transporter CrcB [Pelosinus baikalensis]